MQKTFVQIVAVVLAGFLICYASIVVGDLVGWLFPRSADKPLVHLTLREIGLAVLYLVACLALLIVTASAHLASLDRLGRRDAIEHSIAALGLAGLSYGFIFTPAVEYGYLASAWRGWGMLLVVLALGCYFLTGGHWLLEEHRRRQCEAARINSEH